MRLRSSPQTYDAPEEGTVGWCDQLFRAYEERREETVDSWWNAIDQLLHRRVFDGNRIRPDDLADSCVEPPRLNQIVNLVVSTVFNRRPKFFVQAATSEYEEFASWAEEALNNDWSREYSTTREVKLATQDCTMKGFGVIYTIPETDFGAATKERRRRLNRARKLNADARQGLVGLDDDATSTSTLEWVETGVENHDISRIGRIASRRIDPWRMFFDWTAESDHDLKHVGRWYYATKASVERQTHWNQDAVSRIQYGQLDDSLFTQSVQGDPRQYVRIFEGWFKNAEGRFDLKIWWDGAKSDDPFLYEAEAPLEHGHPFRFLRWNETGSMLWCPSDVLNVYQSIVMERHVQTRMYDQMMRQACDVNLVDGDVVSEDDMIPTEADGVGLMIRLTNLQGRTIDQVFRRLQKDPISPESTGYLALLQKQIEDGLGLDVNQMGDYGKSETSATEAAQVNRSSQARGAIRFAAQDEFVGGIAHDRLRLNIQFYDESTIRALAGPTAARLFALNTFTAGDVQFGLHVGVVPGSMQAPSDEAKGQALGEVLMLILQGQQMATQMVNGPALFLEWLKSKGIHDGSKLLMPGVTAEQMQVLAAQMAMQGQQGSPAAAAGPDNAEGVA